MTHWIGPGLRTEITARGPGFVARLCADRGAFSSEDGWLLPGVDGTSVSSPLVALIDGFTGLADAGGELAVGIVIDCLKELGSSPDEEETISSRIALALRKANTRVCELNRRLRVTPPDPKGTFCGAASVTALWLSERSAVVAQAGETSALRVRSGQVRRLTRDDTLLGENMRQGVAVPPDRFDQARRIITKCIGGCAEIDISVEVHDFAPGDRIVVSTRDLIPPHRDDPLIRAALLDTSTELGAADNLANLIRESDQDPGSLAVIVISRDSQG